MAGTITFDVPLSTAILYPHSDAYDPITNLVTVTKPEQSYFQVVYYPSYLHLVDNSTFQINFTFSFADGGPGSGAGADGFAFVLHNLGFQAHGDVGKNLGVPVGALGVRFSTYIYNYISLTVPGSEDVISDYVPQLDVKANTAMGPYNSAILYNNGTFSVYIEEQLAFSHYYGPLPSFLLGSDVVMGFTASTGANWATCKIGTWSQSGFATMLVQDQFYNVTGNSVLKITTTSEGLLGGSTSAGMGPTLHVVIVNGTVPGLQLTPADGTFTYTPPKNFVGYVTFDYYATDDSTVSNVATVEFMVLEAPPSMPSSGSTLRSAAFDFVSSLFS